MIGDERSLKFGKRVVQYIQRVQQQVVGVSAVVVSLIALSTIAPSLPTVNSISVITDTEIIVLQQIAKILDCPSDISVQGTTYHFSCMVAMGHSIFARMERFTNPDEARAAFDTARGDRPLQRFHCYPSYSWQYEEGWTWLPMQHRIHSWQADRWLIHIEAFDDTHYLIAPPPLYVSELVYQAAKEHDLFSAQPCEDIYLPYVVRKGQQ